MSVDVVVNIHCVHEKTAPLACLKIFKVIKLWALTI